MLRHDASKRNGGIARRDLLKAGMIASAGFALPGIAKTTGQERAPRAKSCILILLTGGPSHLDTWDMKPDAPDEIRGPFRPIRTNVPGIEISEIFPRMARHADKFAIVRGMHHEAAPVHDAGFQLMQTGRLFEDDVEYPHVGAATGSHVLLPHPVGNLGGNMPSAQRSGFSLPDAAARDVGREPLKICERYGLNSFGMNCLIARRLVESGVGFVTVNMFDTVFGETTWDSHGYKPFSAIRDYHYYTGPLFDLAYTALLTDLEQRGLLSTTLVVATGEFGRTPKINPAGGRDHWPQCWSLLMAGGGIRGGQVIGSSDSSGAHPKDRPTSPAEIVATMYYALGVSTDLTARPVHELFV